MIVNQQRLSEILSGPKPALFLLGAGILCPWSAWITASDYFITLYPTAHIDRLFAVLYFLPNLITLTLLSALGDHYAEGLRVKGGFWGYLIALICVPFIDLFFIGSHGRGTPVSLLLTLALVILTGVSDAVAQGSLFGSAARVEGGAYTQALLAGTAASGTLISLLRIITKASMPTTLEGLRGSTAVYFIVAGLNCAACLYVYDRLVLHEGWKKRKHAHPDPESHPDAKSSESETRPLTASVSSLSIEAPRPSRPHSPEPEPLPPLSLSKESLAFYRSAFLALVPMIKRLWKPALALVAVFWITLSIFPGVLAEDRAASESEWFGILLIFAFNLGDFGGKMLPSSTRFQYANIDRLLALAIARALFLLVYLGAGKASWSLGPMFILTLAFGASNGWLATNLMMHGPASARLVPGTKESELGGTVLVTALMLGLTLGAFSGWLWLL